MTKAVIFDMDGILFDTENVISRIWYAIAERDDIAQIKEVLHACIGLSYEDARLIFYKYYGDQFPFDDFRAEARTRFYEQIERDGMPIKLGAEELLMYLKEEGYKIGLASSTKYEHVIGHLERTGFRKYFEVVVGGDMVKHSKPNPEIYQIACRKLGVKPEETYCIEDSFNGVRAGHAAGMKVIMVPDILQPIAEIEAVLHGKHESLLKVKEYFKR